MELNRETTSMFEMDPGPESRYLDLDLSQTTKYFLLIIREIYSKSFMKIHPIVFACLCLKVDPESGSLAVVNQSLCHTEGTRQILSTLSCITFCLMLLTDIYHMSITHNQTLKCIRSQVLMQELCNLLCFAPALRCAVLCRGGV